MTPPEPPSCGPVVGALIVVSIQSYLSSQFGEWVTVIQGVVFVAWVLAFGGGSSANPRV